MKMLFKLVFVLVAVCILGYAISGGGNGRSSTTKPTTAPGGLATSKGAGESTNSSTSIPVRQAIGEPARPTNIPVSSATAVYSEYEANEVKADEEMKDRLMAVSGVVERIAKDFSGKPYVILKGSDLFGVQCFFDDPDQTRTLSSLTVGQIVTIAGECKGKMGNVVIFDCWFYTPSK